MTRHQLPPPYRHEHGPVKNANDIVKEQLTFGTKSVRLDCRQGGIVGIHHRPVNTSHRLGTVECHCLGSTLGSVSIHLDESCAITTGCLHGSHDHDESKPQS